MDHSEVALDSLRKKLGNKVITYPDRLFAASHDGLKIRRDPQAVIEIGLESEVGEVLKLANQFSIPVTLEGNGVQLNWRATPSQGGGFLIYPNLDHWRLMLKICWLVVVREWL